MAKRIHAVALAPDGRTLAFADHDGSVHVRDLVRGRDVQRLARHTVPKALLQELANGAPGARLTRDAAASLERVAKRSAGTP